MRSPSPGWPTDPVLVIDEDEGPSGRKAMHRTGFQRLPAEVTMDQVGLVLGPEMSRLIGSSKDWRDLIELCAMFGTLLADQDGVYNSKDTSDPPAKLAGESRLPLPRVRDRVRNGWVHGRQTRHQKLWIARADADDLDRLRRPAAVSAHGRSGYPPELTTPRSRPKQPIEPEAAPVSHRDTHPEKMGLVGRLQGSGIGRGLIYGEIGPHADE
jgi:hypothetical protein